MSGPGMPMPAMPGAGSSMLEQPTAGAEAVQQSQIAQAGQAAWAQLQSMPPGQRPEYDLVKALMMYVMTEGPAAPQAQEMTAWLQDHGFNVPGMTQPGMDDFDADEAPAKKTPSGSGPTVTAASEPPATIRPGGPKPSGPKKYP